MISIIIPCYNASKHIKNCYTHLTQQKEQDWEAIFINDGSTDNTLELLNEILNKDHRIKIYTQNNKGAAKAREYGIKQANGEYITFLDVDDYFSRNALNLVYNIIKNTKADIIVSSFNIVYDNKITTPRKIKFESISNIDYLKLIFTGKCGWELCSKVYKRELFNTQIQIPQHIRVGEDAAVFIQLVSKAKYIVGLNKPLYNYVQNTQSASHVKSLKYAEETIEAGLFIEEILRKESIYNDIKEYISPMFLLFLSNSISKGYLGNKHKYIQYIVKNHFNWLSFSQIPIIKLLYILSIYISNGYLFKFLFYLRNKISRY